MLCDALEDPHGPSAGERCSDRGGHGGRGAALLRGEVADAVAVLLGGLPDGQPDAEQVGLPGQPLGGCFVGVGDDRPAGEGVGVLADGCEVRAGVHDRADRSGEQVAGPVVGVAVASGEGRQRGRELGRGSGEVGGAHRRGVV
ncbi:MAG: hypothetical protein ACSLFR_08720, partial [Solirubrobacteraceae bacterium]